MEDNQGPTPSTLLPVEILLHILTFLDEDAPSDLRLHDQPDADMLRSSGPHPQHLKTVSVVSRQLRGLVLPLLFRNAVWYFDRHDLMQVEQSNSISAIPLLTFVRDNNLTPYVKSLTLVIASARPVGNGDIGLYRRGDGSGHYGYSPEPLSSSPYRGERDITFNEDTNWLWRLLFGVIRPLRFTIIAPPRMLASLLSCKLFLGDEWIFDQTHHILSLSRDDPRTTKPVREQKETSEVVLPPFPNSSQSSTSAFLTRPVTPRVPCNLLTFLPWSSILLNEGSSTQVYKTYEYFHRRPPSLLPALIGEEHNPNDAGLMPPTIRALSYIGIFPLVDHLLLLMDNLPRIDRLYMQLVPRNDILKDRAQMKGLDMNDLWTERDSAYMTISSKLCTDVSGNWQYLREFESGDVADDEAWLMLGPVRFSPEWRLVKRGIFSRKNVT